MFPFFLLLYCYWKMYFLCIANYFARNKVYLLTLWTARQRMYCFQTASNWEISVHIAGCPLKKLKKRLISYCHKFMVSDSFTSAIPDFRYMQILSGGRLTVLSVDLPNYVYVAFLIFDSCKKFTCSVHDSIKQVFANHTIANTYFNNKRKISADLVGPDGVKPFKRRIEEESKLQKGFCKFIVFSIWKQPSRSALLK